MMEALRDAADAVAALLGIVGYPLAVLAAGLVVAVFILRETRGS